MSDAKLAGPGGALTPAGGLAGDVRAIILEARGGAVRSVNAQRVAMYWRIGKRIIEEEQGGDERAEYGARLLDELASRIEPEFGGGFSSRQLRYARQFYRTYPIWNAVRSKLNWHQYRTLMAIDDSDKREFYELEAVRNTWTGRELERQVNSGLFERLLASNDKAAVLAVARGERRPTEPGEIIKDPMFLEFLGLEPQATYYEKDLESALIAHLGQFLMEMGNGFTFVARQRRILLEDDPFFIDLVLYNRLLRCFVVVEIKTRKLTHQDLGQLQMYVNYYDRVEKTPDENPTVGILLCADKNDTLVQYSLPQDNRTILASRYQLYLPSEEQLLAELRREIQEADAGGGEAGPA
jgi:predicted nuclease of restriction endonuclease-like (RecB) superfamily